MSSEKGMNSNAVSNAEIQQMGLKSKDEFVAWFKRSKFIYWVQFDTLCMYCHQYFEYWWPLFVKDTIEANDDNIDNGLVMKEAFSIAKEHEKNLDRYCSMYRCIWGNYIAAGNV